MSLEVTNLKTRINLQVEGVSENNNIESFVA